MMNSRMTRPIRASHQPLNPSRYSTKMKPAYTRAEPVSLSATMMSIGTPMMAATRKKSFHCVILKFCRLITVASRSDVVIFEISAGWNLTGPNSNHEWEPFTSLETKMTSTRRAQTIRYIGMDTLSQNPGGRTNRIKPARPKEVSIQTNCLPLRTDQSKMEAGFSEWTDA